MKWLCFILGFLLTGFISRAGIIRVGAGEKYSSVQAALHAVSDGDTIYVEKGLYREKNITISKSVTMIGIGYPVFDGELKYEILSVRSDRVKVSGIKFIHSGFSSMEDIAAIKIYSRRDVVIENNILEDAFFGIYVQAGTHCTVKGNLITAYPRIEQQSGNGIHCWKCDSMLIEGNRISRHRDGIYFEFVTNSMISQNVSANNLRYGLHFMFSHHDSYVSNTFKNNGAGVSVMFTHGVKMLNNLFDDNWGDGSYGLLLKEISDSYIKGNQFLSNTTAIYMEGASRVQISGNIFKANGWALKIQASCMDVNVTGNNFESNSFDIGTNGSLVLNSFDRNYWDKYEGYDIDRNHIGDVPYHPVSLFSMIVEKNPTAMMLFRSFMSDLLDKSEKVIPSITPENLKDNYPYMKPLKL
jgi:nitrous oxidase accessory protein